MDGRQGTSGRCRAGLAIWQEFVELKLSSNDSIFLASDGIFDNFPPDEIIELVRKGGIEEISTALMDLINKKIYDKEDTKKDDISFILFKN